MKNELKGNLYPVFFPTTERPVHITKPSGDNWTCSQFVAIYSNAAYWYSKGEIPADKWLDIQYNENMVEAIIKLIHLGFPRPI